MLAVGQWLGIKLAPRSFALSDGVRVTVDGGCDDPPVLVEAWAHQGRPKAAQKAKVVSDALKLLWLDRRRFDGRARKVLAMSDTAAAAHFQGRTWVASALSDLNIEVHVVDLPAAVRERVRHAQERQVR